MPGVRLTPGVEADRAENKMAPGLRAHPARRGAGTGGLVQL